MRKTTVYLDEGQDEALKAVAQVEGRAAAEIIRDAIDAYVERHRARPRCVGVGRGPGERSVADLEDEWLAGFGRR